MSFANDSGIELEPLRLTKLLRKYSECERKLDKFEGSTLEERLLYEIKQFFSGQTWREVHKVMKDEAVSQVAFRESLGHFSQLVNSYSGSTQFVNEELNLLLVKIFLDEYPLRKDILLYLFKESSSLHEITKAVQNLLECLPDYTKQFLKRPRNCNERFKGKEPLLIKEWAKPDLSLLCDIDVSDRSESGPVPVLPNDECQILDTEKQEHSLSYTQVSSNICEEINICIPKINVPNMQNVQIHVQLERFESYDDEEGDNILREVTEGELLILLLKKQRNSLICLPFGSTKLAILVQYILRRNFHHDSKMVYIVFNKINAVSITSGINKEFQNRGAIAFALTDEFEAKPSRVKESAVIVTTLTIWEKFSRRKDSEYIVRAVSDLVIDEITWLYEDVSPIVEDIIFRSVSRFPSPSPRIIAFSLVLKSSTELAARNILKYLSLVTHLGTRSAPLGCDFYSVQHKNEKAVLNVKLVGINIKEGYQTKAPILCCISVLERLKLNQKVLILVENDTSAESMISKLCACSEMNKIISDLGFYTKNSKNYSSLPSRMKNLLKNGYLLLQNTMNPSERDAVGKIITDGAFLVIVSTFDCASFADICVDALIIVALDPENSNTSCANDVTSLSHFSRNTNAIEVINYVDTIEFIFRQLAGYRNSRVAADDYVNRLNSEIVLGNVRSFDQASQWLQSTFSCAVNESLDVAATINECLSILSNTEMIKFEGINDFLSSEIGRVASYYDIRYEAIAHLNSSMSSNSNILEILHVAIKIIEKETKEASSSELTHLDNLALDVKKLKSCDAFHIQDAVGKIMKDYFHNKIPWRRRKIILNRMVQLLKALSEIMFWKRNFLMAYNCFKYWKMINKLQFARVSSITMFDIDVKIYISSNMHLQMEIKLLTKNTMFDIFPAGKPFCFWLWIEKQNYIYNYEYFHTSTIEADSGLVMSFIFPISSVKAALPSYNILIMNDLYPIYEQHFIATANVDATLHDEQILTCFTPKNSCYSDMENVLRKLYKKKCWKTSFLQVYDALCYGEDSVLIAGFSSYGERNITIETAINKAFDEQSDRKVIYTASEFSQILKMNNLLKGKWASSIAVLTGNCQKQLDLFDQSKVIFVTWTHLNMLCETRTIQSYFKSGKVSLLIIDGIQEMSAELECAVIHSECVQTNSRIIGLSLLPVSNISDVAHFLGVSECNSFNFNQTPFKALTISELNLQGFSENLNKNWMSVMNEAVYESILEHCPDKHPALIIVPSVQQLESTANELVMWKGGRYEEWLYVDSSNINAITSSVRNEVVGKMLGHGIGLLFKQMSESDKRTVQKLYSSRKFKVLLTTEDMCKDLSLDSHLVILKGTKFRDKKKNILHDLHPEDVGRLVGVSGVSCPECAKKVVVILCQETKRQLYENYFNGPVLVESRVLDSVPLLVLHKVVGGSFASVADVSDFIYNSFLALRIKSNKSLYVSGNRENGTFANIAELERSIINKLQVENYITVDEVSGNLEATVLGKITVIYNLEFKTIQLLLSKLSADTGLRDMFSLICSAEEFKNINIPPVNSSMESQIPDNIFWDCLKKWPTNAYHVSVLLQGYFFKREKFPLETIANEGIIEIAQRVTEAALGMCVQQDWLKSFLTAHELLQMLCCGCWTNGTSSLYHLPHMKTSLVKEFKDMKAVLRRFRKDRESLQSILAKKLPESCVTEIFAVLDSYPKFEISLHLYNSEEKTADAIIRNSRKTSRKLSVDAGREYGIFTELKFSSACEGNIYVALTDNCAEKIVAFKNAKCETNSFILPITISTCSGDKQYSLYILFKSFVGADKKIDFTLRAVRSAR